MCKIHGKLRNGWHFYFKNGEEKKCSEIKSYFQGSVLNFMKASI